MVPQAPHPDIAHPPACLSCGSKTSRCITHQNNRNGNGDRPYYKCGRCGQFSCFGDMRGIHAGNPACDCGLRSRWQVGLNDKTLIPGALHWRCAVGRCRYFAYSVDKAGDVLRLPRRTYGAEQMIRAGL